MEASSITLPLVIGAAVVDSVNPCAFGVLIFLLAYLTRAFGVSRRMLLHGLVYIGAVFVTYLLAGLLLLPIIQRVGSVATTAYLVIAVLVIVLGLVEIKDAFWYGRGVSLGILPSAARRIEWYVQRISTRLSTSFALGVFVSLVELPCTGAVYIAILSLLSLAGLNLPNLLLLVLYNALFVLPLVVILLLVTRGVSTERLEGWRERHRRGMRLATGLVLLGLGAWMIAFVL